MIETLPVSKPFNANAKNGCPTRKKRGKGSSIRRLLAHKGVLTPEVDRQMREDASVSKRKYTQMYYYFEQNGAPQECLRTKAINRKVLEFSNKKDVKNMFSFMKEEDISDVLAIAAFAAYSHSLGICYCCESKEKEQVNKELMEPSPSPALIEVQADESPSIDDFQPTWSKEIDELSLCEHEQERTTMDIYRAMRNEQELRCPDSLIETKVVEQKKKHGKKNNDCRVDAAFIDMKRFPPVDHLAPCADEYFRKSGQDPLAVMSFLKVMTTAKFKFDKKGRTIRVA